MLQPADQQQLLSLVGLWRPSVPLGMLPLLGLLLLASLHSAVDTAVHRLARVQAYLRQAGAETWACVAKMLDCVPSMRPRLAGLLLAYVVQNKLRSLLPHRCSSVGGVQTWHSPGLIYASRLAVAFGPTLLAALVR